MSDGQNGQAPNGLPSEEMLTRMANEFLAAGYAATTGYGAGAGEPAGQETPGADGAPSTKGTATNGTATNGTGQARPATAAGTGLPAGSVPDLTLDTVDPSTLTPGILDPNMLSPGILGAGAFAPSTAGSSTAGPSAAGAVPPTPAGVPDPGSVSSQTVPADVSDLAAPGSPSLPMPSDPFSLMSLASLATMPFTVPGTPVSVPSTMPSQVPPPWNAMSTADMATPMFYFVQPVQADQTAAMVTAPESTPPLDVEAVRKDFPILAEQVNGHQLVWMDNAATTQKPQEVIDRIAHFYAHENSNIHRGAHELAARATDAFESARDSVARFLGAASSDEIVFVRGTTEAINLVAQAWGRSKVGPGDEIVITHLEHHSNIVPWQMLAAEKDAVLRVVPVDERGQLLMDEYGKMLGDRTRLVAVSQVSNALGTITPVREIIEMARAAGALTLIDGAQAVAHLPVNVSELDPDLYVFSGHKIFAPTGIGVLYGKSAVLESMPAWQGGGNMITDVALEHSQFQHPPMRFEAGTSSIADAVGLGAALDYVQRIGLPRIADYEHGLLSYATRGMQAVPGLHLIGTAPDKASVLSFTLDGYTPSEVGAELNRAGIAVRAGHHCAQPIMRRYGLEETVRPSLAFYNTYEEVDLLVATLRRLAAYAGRQ